MHRLTSGRHTAAGLLAGIPIALVTTTGRRTGRPHTVPLLALPLGDDWAVVASAFGNANHPAWYLNLTARPEASVEVNGRRYAVHATELVDPERERVRRLAVAVYPGFAHYEQRVDTRMIPIVRLERRHDG